MAERVNVVGNLAKDIIDGNEQFGGSAANIAIGLSGLGLNAGILSVLGRDQFSSSYKIYLEEMGVDTSLIQTELDTLPVCEVFSKNNTNMDKRWTDNGCRQAMEQLVIKPERFNNSLVHIVSCPPALPKMFLHRGIDISYEPGPMLVFSHDYFDPRVADESLFIFLNREEHGIISRLEQGIREDDFDYRNLKALVITLGEQGSKLIVRNGMQFQRHNIRSVSVPENKIVDFTGAGDNYKAGFLAGYMYGKTLVECAQIGSEMGAACIKYRGGLLPDIETARIKNKYLD